MTPADSELLRANASENWQQNSSNQKELSVEIIQVGTKCISKPRGL